MSAFLAIFGGVATAVAGTNQWTEAGPDVASISRVEYSASGNTVAYARGGDKFWRTSDAGATWTVLLRNNTYDYPFALDRDPNNAGIILLDGPSGPPLRSVNSGATFDPINPIPFWSPYSWGFGTDGVAYVGGSSTPWVRRSTDHGANWTDTNAADLPTTTSGALPVPYKIAVDPTNSNKVYLAYRHADFQGVYRSTDGGQHWAASAGLPGIVVNDIAINPATTSKLFAATAAGVYVSTDSGANWARVSDPSGTGVGSIDMSSIAIEPSQPLIVYAGGTQRGEVFRSTDGGTTWARRDTGIVATTILSIAPRPGVSGDVLIGTTHTMYRTTDGGANWTPSSAGMKGATIGTIDTAGSKMRVGLYDGGIYESSDGTSWSPMNNSALRARVPDQKMSAVVEIHEASRLFVSLQQDGIFASPDGGASWLAQPPSFNPTIRYNWGGFITEKGTGPVHYVGTNDGVFKTSNDGDTWSRANIGITMPAIMALARNTDGTKLFAGTFNGGVFKSTNAGASWSPINTGLTNLEIKTLAFDESGSNALIVGTNNGLFVTTDDGVSYTRLTDALGAGAQPSIDAIVVEDFLHGSIYVGYQGRVFRSVDRGVTWGELAAGNPSSVFHRIMHLASDGPGVLYVGATYTGMHKYTVATDLRLTGTTPAPGVFPVGTEFSWQGTVQNNGPTASTFSLFSWLLDPNVEVKSPTASRGSCTLSSGRVACDFGVMQVGDSATVNLTVKGVSGGVIKLQPMTYAAETDTDSSNNTFFNSGVKILENVDLGAALTVPGPTLNSSEPVDYVLTVSNSGATIATGGEFEVAFDARDLYTLIASATPTANCPATSATAGVWRCPLPPIQAGASVEYRWRVTPVPGGARTATAVVRINPDNSSETNTANNTVSKTTTVIAANDLAVSIVPSATTVTKDDQLTYAVTVANYGLIPIDSVSAQVTLSGLVTYVSATGATCSANGAVVTCSLGTLAPSSNASFNLTTKAATAGNASTSTQVSGSNPDPHAGNNTAAVSVAVNDPPATTPTTPTSPTTPTTPTSPTSPTTPPSSGNSGGSATGGGGGGGAIDELLLLGLLLTLVGRQFCARSARTREANAHLQRG